MSSGSGGGGGLDIGRGRGQIQNNKTYIGQDAGRQPGALDYLIGQYLQGQRGAQAQNDLLFGGKNYGTAKSFYGGNGAIPGGGWGPGAGTGNYQGAPAGGDGQGNGRGGGPAGGPPPAGGGGGPFGGGGTPGVGGGQAPEYGGDGGAGAPAYGGAPDAQMANDGGNGTPGAGDAGSGWNDDNDPDGTHRQAEYVQTHPYLTNDYNSEAPTGGLYGYYQGQQDNPWQTGPNGESESDVMGTANWFASGERNGDENDVYGQMKNFGTQGTPDGTGRTLEGLSSDVNRNLMKGEFNAPEGEANSTYAGIAEGPNAQERGLYSDTTGYGNTMGEDQGLARGSFAKELANPGYDAETKAAMDQESMAAARSPFDRTRDTIARQAAARGNPGANIGAQIALARDESPALSSTARQNKIAQAQEAIRQGQEARTGLMGSQGMTNAQKEYALGARAGQNAQQAQQRLAGAGGLANMGQALTQKQLAGSAANTALANEMAQRRKAGMEMQAGQNAQQRGYSMQGTQLKESLFNTAAQRKAAGAAGQQHLYDIGQQQRAGDMAGAANVGGKTYEDYVKNATTTGSGGVSI